jgi:hypothetical protein
MMKTRFIKFIRVYWKGILIYIAVAALVSFIFIFMYYGGTSFLGMEGFYRKSLMANLGMYMAMFLVVSVVQGILFSYFQMYFMMGGGMNKMLSKDSAEKGKSEV